MAPQTLLPRSTSRQGCWLLYRAQTHSPSTYFSLPSQKSSTAISELLLCKTALPRPFLCVTPIAARPPHGRPAGAQASNSEQHVARLAAGRAPGHRLSCLPRSNSAALCAPRHAGARSRVFTEHLPLLQGPSALPSCSGISPSWQLTE